MVNSTINVDGNGNSNEQSDIWNMQFIGRLGEPAEHYSRRQSHFMQIQRHW